MSTPEQLLKKIEEYITSQPEQKRIDMQTLHTTILHALPRCRLWFLDGTDSNGKVVSNPNIGYGEYTMKLTGGKTRKFYQIGMSANTTGISIYVMGLTDKQALFTLLGNRLGKASITGYCIKFKSLKDIELNVLVEAIRYGVVVTNK